MRVTEHIGVELMSSVREAGSQVMQVYEEDYSIDSKEDQSPVTTADLMSEQVILETVRALDDSPIVSEESGVEGNPEQEYWLIDPLDGTKDFIQGTGEFAIMVGKIKKGSPIAGIVYAPALGKLWYAEKGEGAYVEDEGGIRPLEVSSKKDLNEYELVVSRNHFREQDGLFAATAPSISLRKMGSVGVKSCMVAEGRADLCIYTTEHLKLWDCCAPQIIVTEAGGSVYGLDGREPSYEASEKKMRQGFIASNGNNKGGILQAVTGQT